MTSKIADYAHETLEYMDSEELDYLSPELIKAIRPFISGIDRDSLYMGRGRDINYEYIDISLPFGIGKKIAPFWYYIAPTDGEYVLSLIKLYTGKSYKTILDKVEGIWFPNADFIGELSIFIPPRGLIKKGRSYLAETEEDDG